MRHPAKKEQKKLFKIGIKLTILTLVSLFTTLLLSIVLYFTKQFIQSKIIIIDCIVHSICLLFSFKIYKPYYRPFCLLCRYAPKLYVCTYNYFTLFV